MSYILALFIFLCAFGLILKFRAVMKPPFFYLPIQDKGRIDPQTWLIIFLIAPIILMFGQDILANSYYDYLLLDVLLRLLLYVWMAALLGEFMLPGGVLLSIWSNRKERLEAYLIVLFTLLLGGLFYHFFMLPDFTEGAQGLISGPQFSSGIVGRLSRESSRGGVSYFVDIDTHTYSVPDGNWWHSLRKGNEIYYAHGPKVSIHPQIFRPDRIAMTIPGLVMIVCTIALWLLTLWVIIDGYSNLFWPSVQKEVRDG